MVTIPDPRYPADILPDGPVAAYGTFKLTNSYTGNAIDVTAIDTTSIGFVTDNLDTATLDSFISGQDYGSVIKWYDQIGSNHLTASLSESPRIKDQNVGSARGIIFEGGSQSGAVFGFTKTSFSEEVSCTEYTIIAVVFPSSSLQRNQTSTPSYSTGSIVALEDGGSGVAKLYADGQATVGYAVTDGTFDYTSEGMAVENAPCVVVVTMDATGTKVWQNEQIGSTTSLSAKSTVADTLYIGRTGASTAGQNDCFNGKIAAVMIYDYALTPGQRAAVAAAFYSRLSINPRNSRYKCYGVHLVGDSIPAGYVTLGTHGMMEHLQAEFDEDIRWNNFSVPGIAVTPPPGSVSYGYLVGLFPDFAFNIDQTSLGSVVVILGGGNDFTIASPNTPSAATVYAGIQSLVTLATAAGATAVIVCTVLPRDTAYQSSVASLNTLIKATPSGYTVLDLAADELLSVNPSSMYADAVHPSNDGHERCAALLAPAIRTALGL